MMSRCKKHNITWTYDLTRPGPFRECPECMAEELELLRKQQTYGVVQATAEPCPKCGNTRNKILYIEECLPHPMAEIIPEHLIHTCTCCEYQWNTPPKQKNQKED